MSLPMSYNVTLPFLRSNGSSGSQPALEEPSRPLYLVLALALSCVVLLCRRGGRNGDIPFANAPKWFQPRLVKQLQYLFDPVNKLESGRRMANGGPFHLLTDSFEALVLPPEYAELIKDEPHLTFGHFMADHFHNNIGAFKPFGIFIDTTRLAYRVIKRHLIRSLQVLVKPVSDETAYALEDAFGSSTEWQETIIVDSMLNVTARLASFVFVGDELARDERWLRISKEYTVHSLSAGMALNLVPRLLRPLAYRFMPLCRQLHRDYVEACRLVLPLRDRRREARREARDRGQPAPEFNDVLEWAEVESGGRPYDAVTLQLFFSFAAIHTTTDLVTHTLALLASHPENLEPLRSEMIEVLGGEGLSYSSLKNLKLLDSTLKEVQRMKPVELFSLNRKATRDVTLSNGFVIRKGELICVDPRRMLDPAVYEDPEQFDIRRFARLREQPEHAHRALLVSTSSDHMGFGHGSQACPGRFFAASHLKVALCHLLLKYDWRLAPGADPAPLLFGSARIVNPSLKLIYRRRKEELDLSLI
ncbi:hypothetical protein CDD83_7371 [Cordyceps sp. RAO-2017]|nr:hypothetical protein CDD83_7371 [Cordyceps sp. RAO-2017]